MAVPTVYKKASEAAIASYSYTDIAEATGIVLFYGMQSIADTTKSHHLTQNSLFSENIKQAISTGTAGATWEKEHDVDFDLSPFNLPQIIRGTAYVSVTSKMIVASGTGFNYFKAFLRKWDGSSETEIANTQSSTLEVAGASTTFKTVLMKITVPQTHFKVGETLRLTIEHWAKDCRITFYHDPKARTDGTQDTTAMEVHIPFKLDL